MKKVMDTPEALSHWLPYKLSEEEEVCLFRWLYMEREFAEPFFEESRLKCRSHPYNSSHYHPVSSAESLLEWAHRVEALSPTAFIFHVSRCGSTLLTQMLSQSARNIVLSEVPLLDELLTGSRSGRRLSADLRHRLFIAVLRLLGRRKQSTQQHLFVKLDSWHIFYYTTLRKWFPYVPFVLLYREPLEVLQSHKRRTGMQMVPGLIDTEATGVKPEVLSSLHPDEYMVKILESMYNELLTIAEKDRHSLLLNYSEGSSKMLERVLDFSKSNFAEEEIRAMMERCKFHSKYPQQVFEQEIFLRHNLDVSLLAEVYRKLEGIRAGLCKDSVG